MSISKNLDREIWCYYDLYDVKDRPCEAITSPNLQLISSHDKKGTSKSTKNHTKNSALLAHEGYITIYESSVSYGAGRMSPWIL